ncbi:MAG: PEPxxWA-CTERM sorting domain-containing protein [Pseudomonadota bacterium]
MAHAWRSLLVGVFATALVVPAAAAEDCVETVSRVPMMSPVGGAPGAAPPRMSRLGEVLRPAPAKAPRVRAARAQIRKAHKPKAVAHKSARPAKRKLARRPAAPVRVAALTAPRGYPDARLMMTRIAPPVAAPEYALIRTTTCTTGAPVGARLMPLIIVPDEVPGPGETFLDGEGPVIVVPPPPGPPFVDDGFTEVVLPPGSPPGPPTTEPPPDTSTAVPEPSTWALMILGFGVTGAGLRRRRALTS